MLSKFCKKIDCNILKDNKVSKKLDDTFYYEKGEMLNKVYCKNCRAYQLIEFLIENKELIC